MIAADPPVLRVMGAMSGTSLDGIDWAVIETDGITVQGFGPSGYRAYSDAERATLRAGLGKWHGPEVDDAAVLTTQIHAQALSDALAQVGPVDLIGVHGQTLAHDPGGRGTLQVGDGAVLAVRLGCPVAWDFRSADVAAGGEGAPLAPAYHMACARHMGGTEPVAFLNLGGVGNLTWLDPTRAFDDPGAVVAFDTGPANAPINDLMQARLGQPLDHGGALAASGRPEAAVIAAFLQDPYFARPAPKSLDRDSFAALPGLVAGLSDADAAATLVGVIAATVADGLRLCPRMPARVLVTGGGRHNPAIVAALTAALPSEVLPVEAVGLDGDMLEAQAFAYLAVRSLRDLPNSVPATTGAPRPISGGRISRP